MKVRKNGARLLRLALIALICVGAVVVTVTMVYVHTKPREISVCLDAGHGAHDAGAVGGGRSEKDDNLRLALLVQSELEARGIRVYMTREDDTFLSLEERCKVANSNKCTLFVALHRNSAESGKGVEVWVANTPSDADWELGENIMQALAKTDMPKIPTATITSMRTPKCRAALRRLALSQATRTTSSLTNT